ncbi:MAG: YceI family protein [Bryobacteraceae bacterium]
MRSVLPWFVLIVGFGFPYAWAEPVRLDVDLARSYIAVHVGKSGFFSAFAGHEHGVLATDWSAEVCYENAKREASSARIEVKTASVVIDTPEARLKAGLKPEGPGADDARKIHAKMQSEENLAVEAHPLISFRTTSVRSRSEANLLLTGPLSIRGRSKDVTAPVKLEELSGGELRFTGDFRVELTDYGIEPESVAGVVNVKDEIGIRFVIYAKPAGVPCSP